jgi:hypothetical protein
VPKPQPRALRYVWSITKDRTWWMTNPIAYKPPLTCGIHEPACACYYEETGAMCTFGQADVTDFNAYLLGLLEAHFKNLDNDRGITIASSKDPLAGFDKFPLYAAAYVFQLHGYAHLLVDDISNEPSPRPGYRHALPPLGGQEVKRTHTQTNLTHTTYTHKISKKTLLALSSDGSVLRTANTMEGEENQPMGMLPIPPSVRICLSEPPKSPMVISSDITSSDNSSMASLASDQKSDLSLPMGSPNWNQMSSLNTPNTNQISQQYRWDVSMPEHTPTPFQMSGPSFMQVPQSLIDLVDVLIQRCMDTKLKGVIKSLREDSAQAY